MTDDSDEYINTGEVECEHTVHDLDHMDSASYELDETGKFYMWGECDCGAPVVVMGHVEHVEVDEYPADDTFGFLYDSE